MLAETQEARKLIRDSAATFVERSEPAIRARELQMTENGFDRSVWKEMAELGWAGILVPEAYGGLDLGLGEMAVVLEELGRGVVPEPLCEVGVLATLALTGSDNEELKAELLPKIIAGDLIPALAWQEILGDAEGATVGTEAKAEGDGYSLSGKKSFVPSGNAADGFIVSAKAPEGSALFWVASNADGISIESLRLADGSRQSDLTFTNVKLNSGARLTNSADAQSVIQNAVENARIGASATLMGVMLRAMDLTLDYLRQRKQFERPIGSFQSLQHRCVDLFMQTEMARSVLDHALSAADEDRCKTDELQNLAVAASNVKARCSEAALKVTQQSIQLHGAIGYTEECDIGLYLKRALAQSAWLGNDAYHRRRYAINAPARETE